MPSATIDRPMHIDKTRQDKRAVEDRPRVHEWSARQIAMGAHVEAGRRAAIQRPRIARGTFALRHLNAYLRYRRGVAA